MAEPKVKNADLIRGVLDGGKLQFLAAIKGRLKWIDCGGDADCWMSVIVAGGGCDPGTHRIKPGSVPHGVALPDLRLVGYVHPSTLSLLREHTNCAMFRPGDESPGSIALYAAGVGVTDNETKGNE